MAPITVSRSLPILDETILARLKHMDVTNSIVSMSRNAIGHGAFSEVFRGSARVEERGEIAVAIKRLRFHLESVDCKKVSETHLTSSYL